MEPALAFSSLWMLNPIFSLGSIPSLSFNIFPILVILSGWDASANQTASLSPLDRTFTTAPLTCNKINLILVNHVFNYPQKNIRIRLNKKKQDSIQWEWPLSSCRPRTNSHITLLWVIWSKCSRRALRSGSFSPSSRELPQNFRKKTPWWDFTGSISTVMWNFSHHINNFNSRIQCLEPA